MSDAELRAAERALAAQHTHETEVRLILARLRVGKLTAARVWLAAWLGHAGAEAALGDQAPPRHGRARIGPWVALLDGAAKQAIVRCSVEQLSHGRARPPWPRGTIAALRAWCRDGMPLPDAIAAASRRFAADEVDALVELVRLVATDRGWVKYVESLKAPGMREGVRLALVELPQPPLPPGGPYPRGA